MLSTINRLISKYSFHERVTIIPEIQKPTLYEYMLDSNIYMQLSYQESFGIGPIEAFSFYNKLIVSKLISSVNEFQLNQSKNVLIIENIKKIDRQRKDILSFVYRDPIISDFVNYNKLIRQNIFDTVYLKSIVHE